MQVLSSRPTSLVVGKSDSGPLSPPNAASATKMGSAEGVSRRVDFSHMTPRQLNAYLDEMTFKGQIDPDDGGALFGSIPMEWYEERPDTPFDFASNIKAIADFDRDNGYPALAAWYDGLLERMKIMEARSSPFSAIA